MKNKCAVLLKAELLKFLGFNEIRYGKDRKKRNRSVMLAAGMIIVAAVVMLYSAMLSAGLSFMGLHELIPAYMVAIISIITIIFNTVKTGNVLFQSRDFELLLSLPIPISTVIRAKFLSMYVLSLVFSMLVSLPMSVVYLAASQGGILRSIMLLTSLAVVPLFPMTIAMGLGAAVTAIASRTKHKNVITVMSFLIFLGAYFFVIFRVGGMQEITEEAFRNIADIIGAQIRRMYPPAGIYHMAIHEENTGAYIIFMAGSVLILLLAVRVISLGYIKIYSKLNAHSTKSNYKWKENKVTPVMIALFKKEWKRYTASGIYVMNTCIGAIFLAAAGIALFIMNPEDLSSMLEIPQIATMFEKLIPMIACLFVLMTSTTASAISIEGREWWIIRSLPVEAKQVYIGKIMVNMILLVPAILIYSTLCSIKYMDSFPQIAILYLMPLSFAFLISAAGLYINVRMPVFDWSSETAAVKQGGAVAITVLVGMAVGIGGVVIMAFVPDSIILWVQTGLTIVVSFIGYLLYNRLCRIPLKEIE